MTVQIKLVQQLGSSRIRRNFNREYGSDHGNNSLSLISHFEDPFEAVNDLNRSILTKKHDSERL